MSRKKLAILITSLVLVGAMVMGGTLAYFTDTAESTNVITLGKVSGTLTEDKSKDGTAKEDGGREYKDTKPGAVLSKVPVVNVDETSLPAYVRVKLEWTGLTDAQAAEAEALLDVQTGWAKSSDGYYYYNKIVQPGTSTDPVFTELTIPTTWGNEMAEKSFDLKIKAELIQSDMFTPVTDASSNITGWGTVSIEAAS